MNLADTIAALASGTGWSTRAVLRVSGDCSADALAGLGVAWPARPGVHRVRLALSKGELPGLLITFERGASYTGEQCAELQVVGSPIVTELVLAELMAREGVRLAEPGEFTARALLGGRLTPEQAEGVGALIGARSARELDAAQRLLAGETGKAYRAIADDLASALALVEAGIDFADQEDVSAIARPDLVGRLRLVRGQLDAHLAEPSARESVGTRPVVVLIGPPNAGKSTLFNALLGRERAIASPDAGTTRDALRETLDLTDPAGLHPLQVTLCDAAGLGALSPAEDAAAQGAQASARDAAASAHVLLYCDSSGAFADLDTWGVRARAGAPVLRVRTKADLVGGAALADQQGGGVCGVCALDGWGLGALRRAIADAAASSGGAGSEAVLLLRHRRALEDARAAIDETLALLDEGKTDRIEDAEIIAGSMRGGLDALTQVAGGISPDDIIGRIFSTFCIGK